MLRLAHAVLAALTALPLAATANAQSNPLAGRTIEVERTTAVGSTAMQCTSRIRLRFDATNVYHEELSNRCGSGQATTNPPGYGLVFPLSGSARVNTSCQLDRSRDLVCDDGFRRPHVPGNDVAENTETWRGTREARLRGARLVLEEDVTYAGRYRMRDGSGGSYSTRMEWTLTLELQGNGCRLSGYESRRDGAGFARLLSGSCTIR